MSFEAGLVLLGTGSKAPTPNCQKKKYFKKEL